MRCDLPVNDDARAKPTDVTPDAAADATSNAAAESVTPPRGLFEQFGRTRQAFMNLLSAHVALLRAELGQIADQIKRLLALGGLVFVLLLTMANMLYIGGFLFEGEWLFGSIGWGLAHGLLFALSLSLVLVLAMVGATAGMAILSFLLAVLLTIVLAVALGSNAAYDTAASIGPKLAWPIDSAPAVGFLAGLVIVGVLFALLLGRIGGRSGAIGGLLLGGVIGALLGVVVGSAAWTWPPAGGFAVTLGLIAWPLINFSLAWPRLDVGEYFARLKPQQTIDSVTETREWLNDQLHSRLPTRGRQ
jgi:hypothetical protein